MWQFTPEGGPVAGNTALTITGANLGKTESDVKVMVDNFECTVSLTEPFSSDRL